MEKGAAQAENLRSVNPETGSAPPRDTARRQDFLVRTHSSIAESREKHGPWGEWDGDVKRAIRSILSTAPADSTGAKIQHPTRAEIKAGSSPFQTFRLYADEFPARSTNVP